MKKYWKLLTLVGVIIVSLTFYFIKISSYTGQLPVFTFHKVAGQEEEVETLIMKGNLGMSMVRPESFVVDTSGTNYLRNEPFIKRLTGFYVSEEMARRQAQFKSFMRGKIDVPQLYFENDTYLAYANTAINIFGRSETGVEMDILHKETGERAQFTTQVEGAGTAYYTDVTGVKLSGDQLHLFMEHYIMEGSGEVVELHQYSFNLSNGKLEDKRLLHTFDRAYPTHGYKDQKVIFSEDPDERQLLAYDYAVEFEESEEQVSEEMTLDAVTMIDLVSEEKKELELPEHLGLPIAFHKNFIYFVQVEGEHLWIRGYDITSEEVVKEEEIQLQGNSIPASEILNQIVIRDHNLYMATPGYIDYALPTLVVFDLAAFELQYLGSIQQSENNPTEQQENPFMNYDVHFESPDLKSK